MKACPTNCEGFRMMVDMIGEPPAYGGFCPGCGKMLVEAQPEEREVLGDAESADLWKQLYGDPDRDQRYTEVAIPDRIGEVIGWRAWKIVTLGKLIRLASVTHSAHWPATDWVYAECGGSGYKTGLSGKHRECPHSSDGRVPGESCGCGLYAASSPEHLDDMSYNRHYSGGDGMTIVGQVAMAGKVIAGTQGWRGEKGRVYKLYCPWDREIGQALANQYRVPVELRRVSDLSDLYDANA